MGVYGGGMRAGEHLHVPMGIERHFPAISLPTCTTPTPPSPPTSPTSSSEGEGVGRRSSDDPSAADTSRSRQ